MIVIPTHNGKDLLLDLLVDLEHYGIEPNKICVVDNKSTDEEHLSTLEQLRENGYNVLHNPSSTYELGAFQYAIDNGMEDDWYALFQDSIRIKKDIFSEVVPKLTGENVYAMLTFAPGVYDNQEDRTFLIMNYGTMVYSRGFFGSMFMARKSVIDRVKGAWKIPRSKVESMGTERGLAVVFDRAEIKIEGLGVYDPKTINGGYDFFEKRFQLRQ